MADPNYAMGEVKVGGTSTQTPTQTPGYVTSSQLQPTTPMNIGSAPVDTNNYQSVITGLADKTQADFNSADKAYNDSVAKNQASSDRIDSLSTSLLGKDAEKATLEGNAGLDTKRKALSDLNSNLVGLKFEAQGLPYQGLERDNGQGRTEAVGQALDQSALRTNAIKALGAASKAYALSSEITVAEEAIDRQLEYKYGPMEKELEFKKAQLERNYQYFTTPAEKKRADAQKALLDKQAADLADKKETEKNISNILLQAIQGGATTDQQNAIKGAKSLDEAMTLAGSSLVKPDTEVVKVGDNTAYLVDKKTGKIIRTFGGGGSGSGSGGSYSGIGVNAQGQITGISKEAQSWIDVINAGTMTLEDALTKIGSTKASMGLKNEIMQGIAIKGGRTENVVNSLNEAKTIAQTMLDAKDYEKFGQSSRIGSWTTGFGDMQARMGQLKALLTRDNLGLLKGSMSDADREFIQSMSTGFRADGGVVSEEYAKGRIESIIKGLDNKLQSSVVKQYTNAVDGALHGAKPAGMKPQDYVEKTLSTRGLSYTSTVNNLLATPQAKAMKQPVPVIDNETGELGVVEYQTYLNNVNNLTHL